VVLVEEVLGNARAIIVVLSTIRTEHTGNMREDRIGRDKEMVGAKRVVLI
jgi:hypothetical protein